MSKKNLIILTKQFPLNNEEQYVGHELSYLAKFFDKIYVYPHDNFSAEAKYTLSLPENVEVVLINAQLSPVKSRAKLLSSFLGAAFYEFWRTHSKVWFMKNFKRSFSIYATQYLLGKNLMKFMEERKLSTADTVLYSFWYNASALCLSILKSEGQIEHFYCRAHSLDLYQEDWGLLNDEVRVHPFRNLKQKYTDTIFSISQHGKDYYDKKFPALNKVVTKYLGVMDLGLNPEGRGEKFTIVTCSLFVPNKRLHRLAETLSMMDRPVKWIHFGDGPLKQKTTDAITSKHVEYEFRGHTANHLVREFYSKHHVDLLVNISLVEGLPVAIMEALSHGIPAVATAVYGTPEAVVDGETGKLIPREFTNEELKSAITWFMDHPEEVKVLRAGARRMYEQRFNAEKNYTDFAKVLLASG